MEINDADVAELVDARDLKSLDGNVVWVRVPPPAPCVASHDRGAMRYRRHEIQPSRAFPHSTAWLALAGVDRAVRPFTAGVVGRIRGMLDAASIGRIAAIAAY